MATTVQEFNQVRNKLDPLITRLNNTTVSNEQKLQTIISDPSGTNAKLNFQNVVTSNEEVTTLLRDQAATLYSNLSNLYFNATTDVKDTLTSNFQATQNAWTNLLNNHRKLNATTLPEANQELQYAALSRQANNQPGANTPGNNPNDIVGDGDGDNNDDNNPGDNSGTNQQNGQQVPGRRIYNPLGKFASYTYNISLYMITPEAYDAFVQTGRRNINALAATGQAGNDQAAGVYLIAQSGGINNKTEKRAPGFEFDYYIDNLKVTSHTCAKSTGGASNTTELSFTIIEPYGFSFVNNLKRAQDALQAYMKQLGRSQKGLENPTRQFFIVGFRFTGYDANGNILAGDLGRSLDPTAGDNGIFETFLDIAITSVKFKLTGKVVTYNITASTLPSKEGFGTKRGLVNTGATIEAGTVYDALVGDKGLIKRLNDEQQRLLDAGSIGKKDTYDVIFLSDMKERLQGARTVSPADLDKYKWAASGANKVSESNDAVASKSPPNNSVRNVVIQGGTPIQQAITQIISQSSYLEDALRVLYTTSLEPNPGKKTENEIQTDSKANVAWFNISAEVSKAEWDDKRSDFAMTITYLIAPYETPVVMSAYANNGITYYGPHKRYDYWYTGLNSEIVSYEQTLDTAFYNVALVPSTSTGEGKGGPVDVPLVPNQRTNMPRIGRTDVGAEAQNSYLTSLYDPAAWASAKITILGDPDFLIQDAESKDGIGQVYNKFYGTNGFTIKANGGQVFIEIDFKEAVDFDHNKGTLSINESVLFWKYPESLSKIIKGICYQVIKVESNFNNGKFTQVLTCNIATFGDSKTDTAAGRENPNQTSAETARLARTGTGANQSGTSTTSSTGLRADGSASGPASVSGAGVNSNNQTNNQQTVDGVANDDGATIDYAVVTPG